MRSFARKGNWNEKILKPEIIKGGYLRVVLMKDSKYKHFSVHRIVAQLFIPNPENKPEVNHKDGNKQNNFVENLEWVTSKENIIHSYKTGLNKGSGRMVMQYDLQGNFIKEWSKIRDVEEQLNICHQDISRCCKKKRKTAGGFIWRYKKEEL